MIKYLSQYLKIIFPKSYYKKSKKIYHLLKGYKYRNYDLSKDLSYNENILSKLGLDIEKIKSWINQLNLSYYDENLSWHYHLFAGLNEYFRKKNIEVKNILEIGTFDGKFTKYLSKTYSNSKVVSIDLHKNENTFRDTYDRKDEKKLKKFLEERFKNLNEENISFIEMNSTKLNQYFKQTKFNLIWIDGDHLNPQVTIDIINCLNLIDIESIICVDDVIMDNEFKKNKYVSNESYQTLQLLEKNKLIESYYLIKRITKNNAINKKYISLSFKKNMKIIK